MTRETVLVDMDGVLADFDTRFIEIWQKRYPDRPRLDQKNRTSFKIAEEFPVHLQDDIREIFSEPGFYRNLPIVKGAVQGMNEMVDSGLDIWICTSPLMQYENCVLEKYQWVDEHLGRSWTERIIMTRNKALVRGDFLIDDHPEIPGADSASWEHILFDAPYNRHIPNIRRITWQNWREVLMDANI